MSDTMHGRPGGLTALAVINFVLAGFGLLSVVGVAAVMNNAEMRAEFEKDMGHPVSDGWYVIAMAINGGAVALLVLSGIGYLGQKRFLGRILGSVYGVLALGGTAYQVSVSGFDLSTIIGIVYPVLTLLLVNTIFKDDLVN